MSRTTRIAREVRGTHLEAALARPEELLRAPGARFVKDHRRTAVASVPIGERSVFIKRFKPYAWYSRLERTLLVTPARLAWKNAARLRAGGFVVPTPLAAVDVRRWGMVEDSYFVTEAVRAESGAEVMSYSRRDAHERRSLLLAAAVFLRRFHDAGFYTRDANAGNFLVHEGPAGWEFFVLDLENVRRLRAVSRTKRLKNLVQLYRTVPPALRRTDQVRFLRAYLDDGERSEIRRWLGDLRDLARRKEAEYAARSGPS